MHGAIEWAKSHPLILVLVAGVVVLFVVLSGGGGGSSAQAGGGAEDNSVALATIGAQTQNYSTDAQLAAQHDNTQAQLVTAGYSYNLQLAQNDSAEDVSMAGIAAQIHIADLQNAANIISIQSQTDQAAITAHTQEYIAAQQTQITHEAFQTQTDIATVNANQNVAIAQYNFLENALDSAAHNKGATLHLTNPNGTDISFSSGKPGGSGGGGTNWGNIIGSVLGAIF